MARTKGARNISPKDREKIKNLVRHCQKFRYTNEETVMFLEDKGFNISEPNLAKIKAEMRADLKNRFEEIGSYGMAEEHDLAIQILPYLEQQMRKIIENPEAELREIIAASSEMRAIKRDMIEFHNAAPVVENVFKYFEEKYGEKAKKAQEELKKDLNKEGKDDLLDE